MKFPLVFMLLSLAIADPQFPLAPPGYFYPPLPYGPPLPFPPSYPHPLLHQNITLRASPPLSPFLLPESPPYSGPVYSLAPPGPPYLSLAPGHGLPPLSPPQHPPPPLSPLARPPLSLGSKGKETKFNDGKYVHDPTGDSFLPYVHDTRGDVALPYIHRGD